MTVFLLLPSVRNGEYYEKTSGTERKYPSRKNIGNQSLNYVREKLDILKRDRTYSSLQMRFIARLNTFCSKKKSILEGTLQVLVWTLEVGGGRVSCQEKNGR